MTNNNSHPLEYLFNPHSIAVVGVSSNPNGFSNQMFLQTLIDFSFPGSLYPINPHTGTICGLKAYKSISDVPGPLDYVIISIPADRTPPVIAECARKGVKAVSLFTANFADSGQREGRELGENILSIARGEGMRLLGPNCMGIYCPSSRLSFNSILPRDSGTMAFISQSGRYAQEFAKWGTRRGLRFSKVISYGNAIDLNESDFIDYLVHDSQTGVIGAYIEGARNGRELFRALTAAKKKKPVLIVKGGNTEAGARTANSHTGSMAGSIKLWDTLFNQTKALRMSNFEEAVDTALAFSLMHPPKGSGVAVVGGGGGVSVLAADACANAGLNIPVLSRKIQQKLRNVVPAAGTSVRNPVDYAPHNMHEPELFAETIKQVSSSPDIHTIIPHIALEFGVSEEGKNLEHLIDVLLTASKTCGKSMMLVTDIVETPEAISELDTVRQKFAKVGIPVYYTMSQAVRALGHVIKYYRR